jgi:AraC family transcriptional regulator, transcriptional activator of the genes for pyochelin and ferripyochelin receptors
MTQNYETDLDGGVWQTLPHTLLHGSIGDLLGFMQPVEGILGIRYRVPAGEGSGHWELVQLSAHLFILTCLAEYREDLRLEVPGENMVKVRILLSGHLESVEKRITLEGTGAFVEAYPSLLASAYTLRSGEPIRLVVLNCSPGFFTEELGLSEDELPFPLSHLFQAATLKPEGSVAPLAPDVLRAANDIMRSAGRFEPKLRKAYLSAKCREIACAMILALRAGQSASPKKVQASVRDVSRIEEARDILLDQFQHPPAIPKLARQVGINQTKLKSLFKAMFGLTIHDFTQKCRMERAVDLLDSTDLSVAEIAYAVGYDFPASFTHAFRKYYGHVPRQVRRAATQTKL